MIRRRKILLVSAVTLVALGAIVVAIVRLAGIAPLLPYPPVTMSGSVLRADTDPRKQTPIAGVTVTAQQGSVSVTVKSEPSGLFRLSLDSRGFSVRPVMLTFQQAGYQTLKMTTTTPGNQLYIVQLVPLQPPRQVKSNHTTAPGTLVNIGQVRIRFSFKDSSTVSVGSLAKQFPAPNTGNVPCRDQQPCSPDGKWKATRTTLPLDAGEGDEFRNVLVSCISGPCAFTKIESDSFPHQARQITVSVVNWSDTANFLVEAEVVRTMVTDTVRQSYPFIVGATMNFVLPPSSEGPTVEAVVDGQYIVFPLGPDLLLTWADCSVQIAPDRNRLYRCQLKPGFKFQE